ncbi:MAG: DUF2752 domain-containing protein [Planctomycetota bacterium]|nr:DUF2752 domain-containing protein [Planctomycetota bacterium]
MDTALGVHVERAPRTRIRLRVAPVENRLPSPWELYSLVLLVGAAVYIPLSYITWVPPVESPLRYTGLACPLCGGTRAVTALCTGQFGLALRYNPLALVVFALLVWGAISWLFMVLPFRKRVSIEASRGQIALFWVLAGIALVGNWAYVLWAGMYQVPLRF